MQCVFLNRNSIESTEKRVYINDALNVLCQMNVLHLLGYRIFFAFYNFFLSLSQFVVQI